MQFEYRLGGRTISSKSFSKGFVDGFANNSIELYIEKLHGIASSVVDPETGKHVPVFIRRNGQYSISIHTSGSNQFVASLEKRLGLSPGEVYAMNESVNNDRLVYLAHASEDKSIAKPIAEGLMQRGINVWYDEWEIGYGESLRRKMEEGLGDCTHFIVLLTGISIKKSWVNEEIDVGLMKAVEGTARFMGLRHDLELSSLTLFLQTRHTPTLSLHEEGLDELTAQILGVSKKPSLGEKPRYVQTHKAGSAWSASATAVAEYFVRNSEHGEPHDPQVDYETIHQVTDLPMPDVRIGVLDLVGSGLLERSNTIGSDLVWPKSELFVTFDNEFMEWNPEKDAQDLAVHLLNLGSEGATSSEVGENLGWKPRRYNPAAAYLISARAVRPYDVWGGGNYTPYGLILGDELLRFVRSI